jgi:hypothetical protein
MTTYFDLTLVRERHRDLLREAEQDRQARAVGARNGTWFSRMAKLLVRPSYKLDSGQTSEARLSPRQVAPAR